MMAVPKGGGKRGNIVAEDIVAHDVSLRGQTWKHLLVPNMSPFVADTKCF